jgi:hypothetical protein
MVYAIYVNYLVIQEKLELFQKELLMYYMVKNVLHAIKIVEDVIYLEKYVQIVIMLLKVCKVEIVVGYLLSVINIRL